MSGGSRPALVSQTNDTWGDMSRESFDERCRHLG
jgi:hypothetical protein